MKQIKKVDIKPVNTLKKDLGNTTQIQVTSKPPEQDKPTTQESSEKPKLTVEHLTKSKKKNN